MEEVGAEQPLSPDRGERRRFGARAARDRVCNGLLDCCQCNS